MTLVGRPALNHPQQVAARGADDGTDDRRTPDDLFLECVGRYGLRSVDLDVAASADNAKAARFYDIEADGLSQPWNAETVWCNPPYSNLEAWLTKAHHERQNYRIAFLLLPANRTEQAWWHRWVEPYRQLPDPVDVHFLRGRRRFDRPGWTKPTKGDRPPFGLCLVVIKRPRRLTLPTAARRLAEAMTDYLVEYPHTGSEYDDARLALHAYYAATTSDVHFCCGCEESHQ